MISDDDLDAMEARANTIAALGQPLRDKPDYAGNEVYFRHGHWWIGFMEQHMDVGIYIGGDNYSEPAPSANQAVADFIWSSLTEMPRLIAEVRRLREDIANLLLP